MNPEKLAQWLRPLMPKQVDTWLKARDVADIGTRTVIDQHITMTAYRTFGDIRNRMILSLPPAQITEKKLKLGRVLYDRPRQQFGLSYSQMLQHTAIFGRTGAGKTNIVMNLFRQLVLRKIPVLFLDWKRNAREILPHVSKKVQVYTPGRSLVPFPFNPFLAPPGIESHIYIQHVVDVLADTYTLGDGSRRLVQKAITAVFEREKRAPDVAELITEIESMHESNRAVRGWKATAIRALEELKYAQLSGGSVEEQKRFTHELVQGVSIVELDGLSQSSRRFLIPLLFSWVYQVKLAQSMREELSLVIVLEEAHNVLYRRQQSTETLTEQLLRQCREIGIGVVLVDQQPNQISSAVLGNVHTSICLNMKDIADISRAAGISLLYEDQKHYLSQLEIGCGIVKLQSHWQQPFLVQFDHFQIDKGTVTDEVLIRLTSGNLTQSGLGQQVLGKYPQGSQGQLSDAGFEGTEDQVVDLIHDILHHPSDGVKIRYNRIGVSIGKGNKLKQDLLALGWLRQITAAVGVSRKAILELTDKGREVFGLPVPLPVADGLSKNKWIDVGLVIDLLSNKLEPESMEHAYWKYRYASRLKECRYEVELEGDRIGGNADIIAVGSEGKLIFEIETGKSDYLSNVRNGLSTDADRVVLVATNEAAMKRVERDLAKNELLIPDRIEIVLKDQSRWFENR